MYCESVKQLLLLEIELWTNLLELGGCAGRYVEVVGTASPPLVSHPTKVGAIGGDTVGS